MDIDDKLIGMSSYCKYFFRIEKNKFWAFQRRIGRHLVTPGHEFRHLYMFPIKRIKTFLNVVKTCAGQRKARYRAFL